MWKNTADPRSTQITWRKRIACWITTATHTHTICNTCCFSTATIAERTRLQYYVIRTSPVFFTLFQWMFITIPATVPPNPCNSDADRETADCSLRVMQSATCATLLIAELTSAYRVRTKWLAHHFPWNVLVTLVTKEGVFCSSFMDDLQKPINPKFITEMNLLHSTI
jgi:hypothetical protein